MRMHSLKSINSTYALCGVVTLALWLVCGRTSSAPDNVMFALPTELNSPIVNGDCKRVRELILNNLRSDRWELAWSGKLDREFMLRRETYENDQPAREYLIITLQPHAENEVTIGIILSEYDSDIDQGMSLALRYPDDYRADLQRLIHRVQESSR